MQIARFAAIGFVVASATLPAHAAPILPGNATTLTLTSASALTAAGLGVVALGTASISMPGAFPVISFPITGGTANADGTAVIQHAGSGLELTNGTLNSTASNLTVDTSADLVDAVVVLNGTTLSGGTEVPIFQIGTGLTLTLTSGAAGALNAGLMTTALSTSLVVGTAATDPIIGAVPEPATIALLGLSALGLCGLRQRCAL